MSNPRTTPSNPLRFCFDFVSPYAFIAWTQIHAIAERNGRTVQAIPILFAGVLDAHGQKGPAEIPVKRLYTFKDAYRKAHRLGLTLVPPPSHPFNPLLALRVASLPMTADEQRRLTDALYAATWLEGTGIETPALVAAAATRAGLDGEALVAAAGRPEAKERLRKATEQAVAQGAFGVPTTFADEELFFGTDSLDLLDGFLRGEDPVPRDLAWAERPVSATRRALRSGIR